MRRYFILLFLLLLFACQAQEQPPVPAVFVEPLSESPEPLAPAASHSPVPVTPTVAMLAITVESDVLLSPEATATSELMPSSTQMPPAAYPDEAVLTDSAVAYPGGPAPVEVKDAYPDLPVESSTEPIWSYRIVNEYPHDISAYTQGLVIEDNLRTLIESTGRDSSLRRVELETGVVEQTILLPDQYFGEGMTLFDDRIIQITWQSQVGFIYESENFELLGEFYYPHEGWGITHDGSHLIVSDGTDVIRFWDPETFQEARRIQVMSAAGPVALINELEYVDGEIWANIWHSDLIARISPIDGKVLGWIDLSGLLNPQWLSTAEAVLNGIAYDSASQRLFVTGKLWPSLFEIEVVDPTGD